ncbi:hypothetical protein AB4874_03220 [Thioclava sp. 15-R06ZXC-3]|uniref:Uncharacterized protein n=1 Tax=Thioclava arctica TaxID=3238301 RepID=A0ABV3TGJ8_9RHOB
MLAVADHVVADLPRGEAFDCLDLYASRLPAKIVTTVLGLLLNESRWFAQQSNAPNRCLRILYDLTSHDEFEAAAEAL